MGLSTKVGSLASPNATGNQAYTGVGFQPKALIFFLNQQTADGNSPHAYIGLGFAISASSRAAIAFDGEDATAGNADSDSRHTNAKCITLININGGATELEADLVSMDADGFTLNWTTVDGANQYVVNYLALGGDDLTNVFIKELTSPTATGNQAYTGVGFQPDCIITLTAHISTAPPTIDNFGISGIGFATASAQGAIGTSVRSGVTGPHQQSVKTNRVVSTPYNSAFDPLFEASLVSLDADGFTLNWTAVDTSDADYVWVLCLKGGQYKIGSLAQPGSTGDQQITGVGFLPGGLLLLAASAIAAGVSTPARQAVGAASSSAARATIWWGHDTGSAAPADSSLKRDKVIALLDPGTPTLRSQADLVSFDADGFTLNWDTVDATASLILYLAFEGGPPPPGESLPPFRNRTLHVWHTRN